MQNAQFALLVPAAIVCVLVYWYCSKKQEETDEEDSFSTEKNFLDLHGYGTSEAIEEFKQFLTFHRRLKKHKRLRIITGWGKHSPNLRPTIKPAIKKYLKEVEPCIKIGYSDRGSIVIYKYY